MTNKKFKVAAMSLALTACVAAQPLMANAADETNAVPSNDGAPADEQDTASSTPADTNTEEKETNTEEKDAMGVLDGEGVTVDYDHSKDKHTETPDSSTTESTGDVNRQEPEAPREEREIDSEQPGKTDIGDVKKTETETRDTETVLDPSTTRPAGSSTTTNPDGSTTTTTETVTEGTTTTTTTGKGHAESTTDETFTGTDVDLEKELDGGRLTWDTETETKFGDYTVTGAEEHEGSKTFTLTKKDQIEEGSMTGEDIAKLIEAGYTDNGDGTYTLEKEYTDSKGQKHTTTIRVDSSTATRTTSTTLTITMESQKDEHTETPEKDYTYPSTTVKGENGKEYPVDLKKLLDNAEDDGNGGRIYTDEETGLVYTIRATETSENLDNLKNDKLKDLLNESAGSERYTVDDEGNLFYTTEDGEVCPVSNETNKLLRLSLSVKITVKDPKGATSDTKVDGGKSESDAKSDAQKEAQDKALREALAAAIEKETGKRPADDEIDLSKVTDNKFEWKDGDTTYIFTYTEKGTVSTSKETKKDGAASAEENTETATAEVTGSTVIWTERGKTHTDENIKTIFGDGFDFTQVPTGADFKADSAEFDPETGRLVSITTTDGKTYHFTYETGTAPDDLSEHPENISNAEFTKVSWKVTEKTKEVEKEETVSGETVSIFEKSFEQTENEKDNTYTFKIGKAEYAGMTKNEDGTFSRKNADGSTTVISIVTSELTEEQVRNELEAKGYTDVTFNEDGTISYTTADGVKYKGSYNSTVETVSIREYGKSESLVASASSKEKAQEELLAKIEAARKDLKDGESLLFDGQYEFTKETEYDEIVEIVKKVINYAVNFEELDKKALLELLENQKADADAAGKSYDGKTYEWYRGTDGNYYRKDKVEDTKTTTTYDKHGRPKTETQIKVNGEWITVSQTLSASKATIDHLDLATDSKLTMKDSSTPSDAILLRDGMKFEWNSNAQDLIDGKGNTESKFMDKISYDNKGNHYEYPRASWEDGVPSFVDQNPTTSAYYKLTGTVAYDSLNNGHEFHSEWEAEQALEAYKKAHPEEAGDLTPTIVMLYKDQNYNNKSEVCYKVYLRTSSLTSYGYMSMDSNTCGNSTYGGGSSWIGGFDLRIDDLTQVDEKHVTAHGKDVYSCTGTLSKLTSTLEKICKDLNLIPTSKTVTDYEDEETGHGSGQFGSYDEEMSAEHTYDSAVTGTGTGTYTTYKDWVPTETLWSTVLEKLSGFFHFDYTSTDRAEISDVVRTDDVHTEASVDYTYSYSESTPTIVVSETTETTPPKEVTPPDEVVPPTTPELPPVQDATPDTPETPDAPVTPEAPVLPPVQDAHITGSALPQTGVNWLTAIGLALSGMTLMVGGAWASLTGKHAKH